MPGRQRHMVCELGVISEGDFRVDFGVDVGLNQCELV